MEKERIETIEPPEVEPEEVRRRRDLRPKHAWQSASPPLRRNTTSISTLRGTRLAEKERSLSMGSEDSSSPVVMPRRGTFSEKDTSSETELAIPEPDEGLQHKPEESSLQKEMREQLLKTESATTFEKSRAMKHFLNEYYRGFFFYLIDRNRRLEELKAKLNPEKTGLKEMAMSLDTFFRMESDKLRKRRTRTTTSDFQTLALIGKGGFGSVFLVRHKKSGGVFAMKKMNKEAIKAMNKISHIQNERDILVSSFKNPWLVHLHYSFQDSQYLYLVMEYIAGGDFRSLLSNMGGFPEEEAKFYIAEMIFAVGSLHELGYIHRDLKPDNFLIDKDGHVRLADFGLSKKGLIEQFRKSVRLNKGFSTEQLETSSIRSFSRRSVLFKENRRKMAYSMVGSPDYMAVEVLKGLGYDFSVDWWSIGVLLFELIVGAPPFCADTPEEVFSNIMNFKECLEQTKKEIADDDDAPSPLCWDLIHHLICEPELRLGKNNFQEILAHPFFHSINIKSIRSVTPPFVPQLEGEVDLSYFDGANASLDDEKEEPSKIDLTSSPKSLDVFNFTFRRPTRRDRPLLPEHKNEN